MGKLDSRILGGMLLLVLQVGCCVERYSAGIPSMTPACGTAPQYWSHNVAPNGCSTSTNPVLWQGYASAPHIARNTYGPRRAVIAGTPDPRLVRHEVKLFTGKARVRRDAEYKNVFKLHLFGMPIVLCTHQEDRFANDLTGCNDHCGMADITDCADCPGEFDVAPWQDDMTDAPAIKRLPCLPADKPNGQHPPIDSETHDPMRLPATNEPLTQEPQLDEPPLPDERIGFDEDSTFDEASNSAPAQPNEASDTNSEASDANTEAPPVAEVTPSAEDATTDHVEVPSSSDSEASTSPSDSESPPRNVIPPRP